MKFGPSFADTNDPYGFFQVRLPPKDLEKASSTPRKQ